MNTFPLGSCFLGNGQCAFTLWAPLLKQAAVHLVAPEERLIPMVRDQGFEGGPNSHVVGTSPRTMKVDTFMATSDRLNAFLSEAPS